MASSSSSAFFSKEQRDTIAAYATDTADVARRYNTTPPKVRRTQEVHDCHKCNAKDGLEIASSGAKKGVWKCFHCDTGGKGGIALLTDMYELDWRDAYAWVAREYNVDVQPTERTETMLEVNARHAKGRVSFRDLQLKHSGIPEDAQVITVKVGEGKSVEQKRYTAGTMNSDGSYTAQGDDMVLWYMDLDGQYIMYKSKGSGKSLPLVRVRYQHPDLHKDKEGKPVKYRSPFGSGSHLWLPNHIIAAHAKSEKLPRLYVVEGEKKADKMCLHGMPAVGIMGIHNLAFDTEMPRQFELIISRCQVEEVVFVVDSDWQDISISANKSVDSRPRTFLRAVQKFREYFYGFRNSGMDLRIYFAAGADSKHKGMDDLLSALEADGGETQGQPGVLKLDMDAAITDAQGNGEHLRAWNIHPLRTPDQKLFELWHLDDAQKFFKQHDAKLRELGEFTYGKLVYFYNQDTNDFELANQILEQEKFYDIDLFYDKNGNEKKLTKFNYDKIRNFLFNRGIGLYEYAAGQYRLVRKDKHFINDVSHVWIQRFVVEFAETIKKEHERSDVVQMLLKGNTQYLGPNNLNYLRQHEPKWVESGPDVQFMIFRNCYWKITADTIEQRPLAELGGYVWHNQVIQFDAEYLGEPLLQVKRDDKAWHIKESAHVKPKEGGTISKCELYEYIKATSMFFWEKLFELGHDEEGNKRYFARDEKQQVVDEDVSNWKMHIVSKLIAWGYKLRTYRDLSNMRAIICMDGLESQVGKSQGGSGKSIFALATEHCQPVFTVDGKTADLKNDRFLYHGVDDRTREIVIDDVSVNFPFDLLFSQITQFIRVKPFQGAPITLPAPVFTITTNHSLNGEGNSFKRRQYKIGFSNFFNEYRTPRDYFGHQLFQDWDAAQWNLYYNLMATAVQVYMQYSDLGRYAVESPDLDRRRLRQIIGEDFLDFADGYFSEGHMLNRVVVKERVLQDYLDLYPGHRKFMTTRVIKDKCMRFAEYADLKFNPTATDKGRIKSAGFEFICVADDNFDASSSNADKVYKDTAVQRVERSTF